VELADTSAWTTRHRDAAATTDFDDRLAAGELATCDMVRMELLWTTRNATEFAQQRLALEAMPQCPIGEATWKRALDVFERLAQDGPLHHRRVRIPDLLVAAAAELAGAGVLHYDADFELIASVTGQPVRPIAPLGSL
jgi:predicted nucleic acid-binding protein